ncbi:MULTISPECIES: DNA cytosine methyltransferase [unclassified Cryobacterium]|uniref:DNA cytosine methyltransferase n=1 Tax=unclassified Cryobacterium TaxID=2649013 RepID=UPI002AB55DA4|nr:MULTISPECIES: DNA cytosine methyltransferase [unclassified Cryobacterium]MDY7542625.1 DNA cytosine methyltransferase [Cryobacterium sp. 5B3]MEB0264745.1 DNA cytosine methyltransferase [Cryobacterium sp. 10I5]MEB0273717.1 DNA cytosine methyltransferase [Cryobacterium sp. 5B3]
MSTATLDRPTFRRATVVSNGLTVTDLFCGAGGSSSGLVAAGFRVVIAANHWKMAIDSHQINHPTTDHDSADISQVEPSRFPTTDILWASPECTNHSVAKGIKRQRAAQDQLPGMADKLPDAAAVRSRATMWDVPRFAEYHMYKAIIIENVVDAYRWVQFPAWLMAMESLGYDHEIAWVNSMHAQALGDPAPQSRDRMYVVFWRKGNTKPNLEKWTRPNAFCETHGIVKAVQVFKKAERWGRYKAQYVFRCGQCAAVVEPGWLPASSAIDFNIEGTRIGDRDKPLSPKTMTRIEKGIERYWKPLVVENAGTVYDAADPKHPHYLDPDGYYRANPTSDPLRTISTWGDSKGLALPPIITDGIRGDGTVQSGAGPLNTQTTAQTKGVMFPPFLAQFRERERTLDATRDPLTTIVADGAGQMLVQHASLLIPVEGREGKSAARASEPHRTQSTRNETGILIPLRNHGVAKETSSPIDTVSANGNHHALVMRNNTGGAEMTTPATESLRTLTTGGHQSLLVPYYGTSLPAPVSEPHRTLTTVDRYSLLTGPVDIEDCIFRMLTPDEIKRGMGFAGAYVLLGTKREQVKQSGNAVTPPNARDLGAAVAESLGAVFTVAA